MLERKRLLLTVAPGAGGAAQQQIQIRTTEPSKPTEQDSDLEIITNTQWNMLVEAKLKEYNDADDCKFTTIT
jgi:hypothetical protein